MNKNLKVVILKCPYINWQNEKTQKFFTKMVDFKLKSYCSKHHVGVMPVDTTDFICDHILICSEDDKGLTPLLGVKSLDYRRCQHFHVNFTIDSFLKNGNHHDHLESLNGIIQECEKKKENIAYYSSWAMLPEVTRDRDLSFYLKTLFTGLTVLYHTTEDISHLLGLGVPKYRTDTFFYKWGFKRVEHKGQPLQNIPFFILGGIDGVFIHLDEYTPFAIDSAEKTLELWKNRLEVGLSPEYENFEEELETKKRVAYG